MAEAQTVRKSFARRHHWRWGVVTSAASVAAVLFVGALAGIGVSSAGASTQGVRQSDAVELEAEIGLEGVVPGGAATPIRLVLTSPRARVVALRLTWETGSRSVEVELGADAPTQLDLSLDVGSWLDIEVVSDSGDLLDAENLRIEPDNSRTLVGIGQSLATGGAPRSSPTIGAIQEATLVALTEDLWSRPGALGAMSGVVLSAADLDALTDEQQARLREWVWSGGDLAFDLDARPDLPVVDLPSTGSSTAIGAGWVRFTGGAAASGAWSQILEPAVIRAGVGGNDLQQFVDPSSWESMGLIRVGFIPTWVVVLAVFGTALLAGPVAWFALRTRRNRRWMWAAAPGLSVVVALGLLVAGQDVFTRADVSVVAEAWSSPWASTATVLGGLKASTTLELGAGIELLGSVPEATVTDSGDARSVRIDLPRNSFGTVGIAGVELADGPRLEVTAVAAADGTAEVTVTNHSTGSLTDVTVAGNGRARSFSTVGPGESETLPFEMTSQIPVFGPIFPRSDVDFAGPSQLFGAGLIGPVLPASRGLVLITGTVRGPVSAAGVAGDGTIAVSSVVPVSASGPEPAAFRIDEMGGLSNQQLQRARDQVMFADGGDFGPGIAPTTVVEGMAPGAGEVTTTAMVGAATGVVGGETLPILPPDYVRFSFPAGRDAAPCGMHTMAGELSVWDGARWVGTEKVGDPYLDPRITGLDGQDSEMQDWMLPAVEPGGRLHLRVGGRTLTTPAALLFDCAGRP